MLQQLSTSPVERLKRTGGSSWLRQCHEAYIYGSSTRGVSKHSSKTREIQKKDTGTNIVSSKTFEKRPIVTSSVIRERRASFSGVVRRQDEEFWAQHGLNVDALNTQTSLKSRSQRRASFSEVALPSMLSHRLRNDTDGSNNNVIYRSLSFLRNKSNDILRTMSFGSQASTGSRDSMISNISSGRFTPIVRKLLRSVGNSPDSSVSLTPRDGK